MQAHNPAGSTELLAPAKQRPIILGFFDVLGFSNRVETEGPHQTAAVYHHLIERTVKKTASRMVHVGSNGKTRTHFARFFTLDVQAAYFSDTILMWVPLQQSFAGPFLQHCATFVCEALAMNIPVRGTIALGEAVMDRATGTYIGMPIVEAAAGEKIQEWLGVAFAASAFWESFFYEVNFDQFIEYTIPVKPGHERDLPPLALDWSKQWEDLYGSPATEKLKQLNAAAPHQKIVNAISFVEYCIANRDWHKNPPEWFEGKLIRSVWSDGSQSSGAEEPLAPDANAP